MSGVQLHPDTPLESRPMPNLAFFQKLLAKKHGEAKAASLAEHVQAAYDAAYTVRPRFEHPALREHLEDNMLPGLALYRALADDQGRDGALHETFDLMAAKERHEFDLSGRIIRYLPGSFALFRFMLRREMSHDFPSDGWTITWLEDNPRRMAFDITRCVYLETMTAYGAPELTPAFCAMDDVLGDLMKPAVVFERAGSLARGNDRCDFCYGNGRAKA